MPAVCLLAVALVLVVAPDARAGQASRGTDEESATNEGPAPPGDTAVPGSAGAVVRRWLDLQTVTLSLRHRFVETSDGVTTVNQVQHRELLKGRVKFDHSARYALGFGVSTGVRFTSGWNHTAWGDAPAQGNVDVRTLFLSAEPWPGLEGQVGGLYIVQGQSTEITTYDDDGYLMGERVSIRRPQHLFFDEISLTVAYFVGGTREEDVPVSARFSHIDEPNYQHVLVGKKIGAHIAVSADFTTEDDRTTWRQAVRVVRPGLRVVDSIVFEQYERTNASPAYGFAISFAKQLTGRLSLNQFGYARIDPLYGGLNADRFHIGNRAFVMATYAFSPEFSASLFVTTAVGGNVPLSQQTLSNAMLTYNALPALKRTGLF